MSEQIKCSRRINAVVGIVQVTHSKHTAENKSHNRLDARRTKTREKSDCAQKYCARGEVIRTTHKLKIQRNKHIYEKFSEY